MRMTYRLKTSDDLEATLTITMTVRQWTELKGQLLDKHPAWKLSSAITTIIMDAEKVFYGDEKAVS